MDKLGLKTWGGVCQPKEKRENKWIYRAKTGDRAGQLKEKEKNELNSRG